MIDDHTTFVPPFTAVAPIYDRAGFGTFALKAAERYLLFAMENGWAGRRIIDIGCKTGAATWWLAQEGYRVIGVDENEALLTVATTRYDTRELAQSNAPDFVQCDLRALDTIAGVADLALASDGVFQAASSLRDVEAIFKGIYRLLDAERLLIFDLETIGGLAASAQAQTSMVYDDPRSLTVIARPRFNFETLTRNTHVTIWQRHESGWQRADEQHTARGYPVQAIRTLLERAGFALRALLTPEMRALDPTHDSPARIVFVAEKQPESA